MILHLPKILTPDELAQARGHLVGAGWADGRISSGHQSALAKQNQQLPEDSPVAKALSRMVLQALARNRAFTGTVLPLRVFPPRFNRYADGGTFGDHIDNTILDYPGGLVRGDVSGTLFLAEPSEYDGGDLVIEDTLGSQRIKLPAGDLIVYPSGSVHRVEPVTRGARLAAFFWVQSMVRDDGQRTLLYDLDRSIGALRQRGLSGEPEMVMLTGIYHNLLRRWAEV